MSANLEALIVNVLQEVNGQEEMRLPDELGSDTSLFGRDGILDSVGLVTLVVAVEQAMEDEFGVSVSLADDKAMSQQHSPYRTIGTLAAYAQSVMQGDI
jgi:D-alanine--poly(phosphoribitol) ligase subunit 2